MAATVTLQRAKYQLRIPATETIDDDELTSVIAEASDIIVQYLGARADAGWTATTTPKRIQSAILLMIGYLWTMRDDQEMAENTWQAIRDLLARDRDPALA